jgi:hypothetical protein
MPGIERRFHGLTDRNLVTIMTELFRLIRSLLAIQTRPYLRSFILNFLNEKHGIGFLKREQNSSLRE